MKIRFLPEADAEFREAARYYEDKAPGLGVAFIAEVHRAAADKQESDCARLLDKINQTEARAEPSGQRKKTLKSDQSRYRKLCGPL